VVFGGDLGRYGRPVLPDPVTVPEADYLLVESTYGDRIHEADEDGEALAAVIRETAGRGGKLIIPSFAIGRVEELLYWIARFEEQKRIPVLPVFLDSPMALEALARYSQRLNELDPELQPADPEGGRTRRTGERRVCAFCTTRFRTIESSAESRQLTESRMPAIVISSSGMATGGRVLHHLKAALPDERNSVLLVGFQAAGTRGRALLEGAAVVKIHGAEVPVRAKVAYVASMSAHADSSEIMRWLRGFTRPPRTTFLVHGEPVAMEALAGTTREQLGWRVHLPKLGEVVTLEG